MRRGGGGRKRGSGQAGKREHRVLRLSPVGDCFPGWLVLRAGTAVKERIKTHRTKSTAIWYKI